MYASLRARLNESGAPGKVMTARPP